MPKKKPPAKTYFPSQQHSARAARGRPSINISMSSDMLAAIDELSTQSGRSRTDVLQAALDLCPRNVLLAALARSEDPKPPVKAPLVIISKAQIDRMREYVETTGNGHHRLEAMLQLARESEDP
jgi:hypothetical protein